MVSPCFTLPRWSWVKVQPVRLTDPVAQLTLMAIQNPKRLSDFIGRSCRGSGPGHRAATPGATALEPNVLTICGAGREVLRRVPPADFETFCDVLCCSVANQRRGE